MFKCVSVFFLLPSLRGCFDAPILPDTYYIAFPKDRLRLKIVVYGVFTLEIIQTLLTTHDAFGTFTTGLANLDSIDEVRLAWLTVPVLGGIGKSSGKMPYPKLTSYQWHLLVSYSLRIESKFFQDHGSKHCPSLL